MKLLTQSFIFSVCYLLSLFYPNLARAQYSNCYTSTYNYVCPWNSDLSYTGSVTYCIGNDFGNYVLPSWEVKQIETSDSPDHVRHHGSGSRKGGGIGCVPPQDPDPCSPLTLTDSSDPCDEQEEDCDSPSEGGSETVGSEVDLFGLRYYDKHTDLKLAAPGGWLSVNRRYSNGSWRMGGTEVILPMSNDAEGRARVSLSGRIFTKTNSKFPGAGQGQDRFGSFVSEDGYTLQYAYRMCSAIFGDTITFYACPWYKNRMTVIKPDGSWLYFIGDPTSGGLLRATGHKDLTHLIYVRDLRTLSDAGDIPFSSKYKIKRVLSGVEKDENGKFRTLLYYNYSDSYNYRDKKWAILESVTTYDVNEVTDPDPALGQVGVFYEYYRGEGSDPDTGLLKSVAKPDGTSSVYTYNSARNLKTKTDYAAGGTRVRRHSSIEYHSSDLQAEDAIESNLMLGALGGPPHPVAAVAYGSGESKRFDGSYNESTGGFYSKVSYSNGSIKEVWLDDEAGVVQTALDGQVVRNVARVGRVERVTTRGNSVTIREYDEFDNLIRETLPSGHVRSWVYEPYTKSLDPFSGELAVDDSDAAEDAEETDDVFIVEATRPVSMTNEIGTRTRYTYADSNWGTDANGVAFNTAPYHAIRSVKVTESVGDLSRTRWEYYDSLDRLVLEIDWMGNQTAYAYKDKTTLVAMAWRPDILDADTGQPFVLYSQTFDAFGYTDLYTDAAGNITDYDYSVSGQLLRETDPLNVSTVYTYSGDELIEEEVGRIGDPGDANYRRGRITRYSYDGSGRLLTEKRVDNEGVEHLYKTNVYDSMGNLKSVTNADGLITEHAYDVYGNRISTSLPLPEARTPETTGTKAIKRAQWNVFGDLLKETNAAGLVTQYNYDKNGRILSVTEGIGAAGERTLSNRYDGLGNIVETTYHMSDGSTGVANYTYDAFGRLVARSGYGVYAETYTYDANDNLATVTNARGLITRYTYDAFGQLYQVFEGNAEGEVLISTNFYDVNGNLIEQIDAEGIRAYIVYDALDRERFRSIPGKTVIPDNWWSDFANVASEIVYNRFGDVERTRAAHGEETVRTYDDFGRPETVTHPTGATVRYEFTAADLIKRVRFPVVSTSGQTLASEIVNTYDPVNPSILASVRQRSGEVVNYYYDETLRQTRIDLPTGAVRTYEYDGFGRVISEADYASVADYSAEPGVPYRTTRYSKYDDFDRLLELTLPEGKGVQSMNYNDKGNLLSRSGSQTYPVKYTYDSVGNLETLTTFYGDSDPAAADISITSWEYDLRGRLERKVYADGSDVDYTYYDNNRLRTRTNAREQVTTYTYDAWGNVDLIDYPSDQTDVDYEYIKGRLDSMTDETGTTIWTYHKKSGLPTTETKDFIEGMNNVTIAWEYDGEGRRTLMTVNGLPNEVEPWQTVYNYDRYGRLELLQDSRAHATGAFVYGYNAATGLLERIESPWQQNGADAWLGEQRTYDSFGRLKSRQLNTSAETPIIGVNSIRYNVLDRRTNVSLFGGTLYAGQKTRAFDYDQHGQLKEQSTLIGEVAKIDHTYEYDAIGNRLNWWQGDPIDPETALVSYVPNNLNQYKSLKLHPSNSTLPSYDADGNLHRKKAWIYTWNTENRLITAEQPGVRRIEYTYDGQGRRISKKVHELDPNSNSTLRTSNFLYLYDGWNLLAELEAPQTSPSSLQPSNFKLQTSYVWGLDLSVSMQGAGGVGGLLAVVENEASVATPYLAAYDFNGNIIGYVDPSTETLVAEYEYGPFGELIRATGVKSEMFNFRFSTKYEDTETGLLYYGYRYYNAETGRWLNRDPIGEDGGLNLYGMVGNDAVNAWDYLGLRSCDEIQQNLDIIDNILNSIIADFSPGGQCYEFDIGFDFVSSIENANLITGLGVSARAFSASKRLALNGTTGKLGIQYFTSVTPSGVQILNSVGNVVGGIGVGIDVVQAGNSFANGDIGGGISNTASAGLGTTALLIASSNPATALAAGAGAVVIGTAEQGALAYIERRDRQSRKSFCERRAELFDRGLQKSAEVYQELQSKECCIK